MNRAALLLAGVASAGAQCMLKAECDRQLNARIKDVRGAIVDTVQSELEEFLQVAPTAILLDDVKYEETLFEFDLSTPNGRDAIAEMLYYQLQGLPELYWIYYGEQSTGRFLGFKRSTTAEVNSGQGITANMLIRTECAGTGQPLQRFKTDTTDSRGGDAIGAAFASKTYDLRGRPWFQQGLALQNQNDLFSDANYAWHPIYTLPDESTLAFSAVRRVSARPSNSGAAIGVVAADYSLISISDFITSLPIPPRENGDRTPVLVIDGPSASILASNVPGLEGQQAEQSTNLLVKAAAEKMYQTQPGFRGTTGWASLKTSITEGDVDADHAMSAVGLEYPAGGAAPVRWVSLIVSDIDMGYSAVDPGCPLAGQTGSQACRETLITATLDFRERTLNFLSSNAKEYLGVGYVVVNSLDETFNLGLFNVGWCSAPADPCGALDLTDAGKRANLDMHMKNLLTVYSELYWVYYATQNDRQYLGYLRPQPTVFQQWECNGGTDNSTCGTAKFTWADNGTVAKTEAVDPLSRPWWSSGWALGYDKVAWVAPYKSGNGAVISIVKKSFDGDWLRNTGTGVWGVDFSLDFIADYIATIEVDAGWVVYVMAKDGLLLGSTGGSQIGDQAANSANSVIKGSSPQLLSLGTEGLWKSTRESTSFVDLTTGTDYFVDYIGLMDASTDIAQSYDWVFVLCAPESSLYDVEIGTLSSGSGRTHILVSVLMAAVAAMAAFVH